MPIPDPRARSVLARFHGYFRAALPDTVFSSVGPMQDDGFALTAGTHVLGKRFIMVTVERKPDAPGYDILFTVPGNLPLRADEGAKPDEVVARVRSLASGATQTPPRQP